MISYDDAIEILTTVSKKMGSENIPLLEAYNRILSKDILSDIDSPPFHNSAMDGFALCSSETVDATDSNKIRFLISDKLGAGDHSSFFGKRTAIKIMTGAPVPEGYDAVIPVEETEFHCENGKEYVSIKRFVRLKENVRFRGEDFKKQDCLLRAGSKLKENELLVLATAGIGMVDVIKKPQVALLSTGNELIDEYQQPLKNGQIYNSNRIHLMNLLTAHGAEATYHGCVRDDIKTYQESIESLIFSENRPDIIISTGAVSKGDYDYIPEVLSKIGFNTLFHRVNIRPGKPILFAQIDKTYYFGLPGNPISASVGFHFFVKPFIDALTKKITSPPVFAKLVNPFQKKGSFSHFLKANAYLDVDGQLLVKILSGQESFKVSPMLQANAWVYAREEIREMKTGQTTQIFFMDGIYGAPS